MGDRSWNYNHSRGVARDNSRPRYSSSRNATYYVNHAPPVRYRQRDPHHQQYNYPSPSPPRHFSIREPEPPITRTIVNSCYQPAPPVRYVHESRPVIKPDSRHSNNSDLEGSRRRSSSGSSSRHGNGSPNPRFYEDKSSPRSQGRRSPSRSRDSRSPTRYMNRSPPRPASRGSRDRSRSRASPQRSTVSPSRQREGRTQNVFYQEQKDKGDSHGHSSRSRSDYVEEQYNRKNQQGMTTDVLMLIERIKEYQLWLTGLRQSIVDSGREEEREDEVDDIEWCLGVIRDINASTNVGIQTLNRAQEIILDLVTKSTLPNVYPGGPAGSIYEKSVPSPATLLMDDSESARSPSPGLNATVTRRKEPPSLNPRVIPTERAPIRTNFNYVRDQDKPRSSTSADYIRAQEREDQVYELMYERRKPPSVEVKEVTNSIHNPPKDFSEFYHRRPNPPNILKDRDMRTSEPSSNTAQWERNDEEDMKSYEAPSKVQDQDMRILDIEQATRFNKYRLDCASPETPAPHGTDNSTQKVPPIVNDLSGGVNILGFPSNMMNPLNPASLPFLNQPIMNPFMNPSVIAGMSGMTGMTPQQIISMQNQAQMVLGFQQQLTNSRPGLLPTPTVTNTTGLNFGFQQPTQNMPSRPQVEQPQSQPKPQQPIVETPTVSVTSNSESTTQDMMSRIMAKAAQSFSHRGRGPVPRYTPPQPQFGRERNGLPQSSSNQTSIRPSTTEHNQEQTFHQSQGTPAPINSFNHTNNTVILDPRLKPRVPREPAQLPVAEVKPSEKTVIPLVEKETTSAMTDANSGNSSSPSTPRNPSVRERLRQAAEDSRVKDVDEVRAETYTHCEAQGAQRKKHVTWDKSPEKDHNSRSRSFHRRNSYGSSDNDKNSYNDTSYYEPERGTQNQREGRNNTYSRTSPRKAVDEKERPNSFACRDRNASRSHPAVLPFEKAVFRNTSESGSGTAKFRIPKLKKPDPPPPEPEAEPFVNPINSLGLDSTTDFDSGIEVFDQIHKSDEEIPDSTGASDFVQEKLKIEEEEAVDSSPPSPVVVPSPSSERAKPLPREADSLIRTLLLESLNPDEAEILQSDEDYLAAAIANLKAELSAKLKANAKQRSSGSTVAHDEVEDVSNTSGPSGSEDRVRTPSGDSKEEEDKTDGSSRSRSLTRRKPNAKRRSSLEKLHDALREMNFDSMMPTGPRRAVSKNQNEDKPAEKLKESLKKVGESSKTEISKEKTPEPISKPVESVTTSAHPSESPVRGKAKKRKAWKGVTYKKKVRKTTNSPLVKRHVVTTESAVTTKSNDVLSSPLPAKKTASKKKVKKLIRTAVENSSREGVVTRSRRSDGKPVEPIKEPPSALFEAPNAADVVSSTTDEPMDDTLNEDSLMDFELSDLNDDLHKLDFDSLMNDEGHLPLQPDDFCMPDSDDETGFMISEDGLEGLTVEEPETVDEGIAAEDLTAQEEIEEEKPVEDSESVQDQEINLPSECHLCPYSGKRIIHHYANNHRGVSIPQARLGLPTYNSLVSLNTSQSPQLIEIPIKMNAANKPICACLFCDFSVTDLNQYFDHLTTHTGEFKFGCSFCKIRYAVRKTATNHLKSHKKSDEARLEMVYNRIITSEDWEFYCYVCRECYYFQLEASNISSHLEESGHSEEDVICIKFQVLGSHRSSVARPSPPPPPPVVRVPTYDPSVFLGTGKEVLEEEIGKNAVSVSPLAVLETCEDLSSSIDHIYNRFYEAELNSSNDVESRNKSGEIESEIVEGAAGVLEELVDRVSLPDELDADFLRLALKESTHLLRKADSELQLEDQSSSLMESSQLDGTGSVNASGSDTEDEDELNDYYFDTSSSDDESCDYYESMSDQELKLSNPEIDTNFPPNDTSTPPASVLEVVPTPQIELIQDINISTIVASQLDPPAEPSTNMECDDTGIKQNLEGVHLYRCAQDGCDYRFPTGAQLKDHLPFCGFLSDNQSNYCCFHCDKRFKQIVTLIEHLKVHGTPKQLCSLCPFRCCTNLDLAKHMRCVHKVNNYKTVKSDKNNDGDVLMFPKDAISKFLEPQLLQQNHMMYSPKVEFLPTEIINIPNSCIFSSPLYCALCNYSTKVRTNIIRHLKLHEESQGNGGVTEVPSEAPVNPVPCLARKELMFDKMVNLAGSSYVVKASFASVSKEDADAAPQFVVDQFRYMCSVRNCKQITVDDSMLRAHMKALHSEVDLYHCPHCYDNEKTRNDPRNAVAIERIGFHLKFHGPRLLKCGHCPFIHIQTRIMETHVAQKHFDRKAIHSVIRNLDDEGNVSNRRNSMDEMQRNVDRWRCALCRALYSSWEDVKLHCETVHKVSGQFMCTNCRFSNDVIFQITNHINSRQCVKNPEKLPSVMIMFARNEGGNLDEAPVHNIWRRDTLRVKHIRGIYLEESVEPEPEPLPTVSAPPAKPVASSAASKSKGATPSPFKSTAGAQPIRSMVCPKCLTYKARGVKDMTIHLHNEFRYQRYVCKICLHKNVTLNSLKVHVENDHREPYFSESCLILKPKNRRIEREVKRCLELLTADPAYYKLSTKQKVQPKKTVSPVKVKKAASAVQLKKTVNVTQRENPAAPFEAQKKYTNPPMKIVVPGPLRRRTPIEVIYISDDDEDVQPVPSLNVDPGLPVRTYKKKQSARKSTSLPPTPAPRMQFARKRLTKVPLSYKKSPDTEPYSFYGKALSPIDIHSVRVLTEVGDVSTSINVANLQTLVDLTPFVPVVDLEAAIYEGDDDEGDLLSIHA